MASSRITGTNENISTYGTVGRDYTALATWETATDIDLVTATTSEVLECYADSASFTDAVTVSGATTDTTYFRILRAVSSARHSGNPSAGVKFTTTSDVSVIVINENNFSVQDVVVSLNNNSANNRFCIGDTGGNTNVRIIACIVDSPANAGAGVAHAFQISGTGTKIVNCLAINAEGVGFLALSGSTNVYYNCTSIGGTDFGFQRVAGTALLVNCLCQQGSTSAFSGTFSASSTTNASSDTTAPGVVTYLSQSFTFVATASKNYHLHRNDLGAKFRGTNLSADATFPFDDDIDSVTITNWSIGFHAEETQQSSRRTGDNENVSTYAASGADYSSLSVWEAATDNDLVTGAVSEVLECDAAIYDDTVSLAGATTDGRYFRIIRPAPGHEHGGLPGSGVEFVATTLTSNTVLHINENFSSIQDVRVATTVSSASTNFGVQMGGSCDYGTVVGVIATVGNAGAGSGMGIGHATGSDRCRVTNCLSLDCKTAGFAANGTSAMLFWTNNTSIGSPTGFIKGVNATVVAQNCLADGNATAGFSGTYATGTSHNASEKADAPGTNNRNSQTFTFVSELGDDYHLTFEDVGALGFGTSMAASPFYNYIDDVDALTVVSWSIGFDSDAAEPPAPTGGGGGHLYRRRRR